MEKQLIELKEKVIEEIYPLIKDKKTRKEVEETLKEMKINKVAFLDELGEWEKWYGKKGITLIIHPKCDIVNYDSTETIEELKDIIKKEKYLTPCDLFEKGQLIKKTLDFYRERNIIIMKVNPFYQKEILDLFLKEIKSSAIKYRDEEELWLEKAVEKWVKERTEIIKRRKNDVIFLEESIKNRERDIITLTKDINKIKDEIYGLEIGEKRDKEAIRKEIQDIKKLDIIKEFTLEKGEIKLSFGEVYLTGKVVTGYKKEGATDKPVLEMKKVRIGNLKFRLKEDGIEITNDNKIGDSMHPHANPGICWGDSQVIARDLIRTQQLMKLVKLLFAWTFTFNEEDSVAKGKLQKFYEQEIKAEKDKKGGQA